MCSPLSGIKGKLTSQPYRMPLLCSFLVALHDRKVQLQQQNEETEFAKSVLVQFLKQQYKGRAKSKLTITLSKNTFLSLQEMFPQKRQSLSVTSCFKFESFCLNKSCKLEIVREGEMILIYLDRHNAFAATPVLINNFDFLLATDKQEIERRDGKAKRRAC